MEKKRLVDILNRVAARRRNPPKEFGCCCKYNGTTGRYDKENNVEIHDCTSPGSFFYEGKQCKEVECGITVDSTDTIMPSVALRRNPPKEYGCCCKYDPYNDVYVKEDDVEMQNCKFPASFHEGMRCKDVYCGSLVDVQIQ